MIGQNLYRTSILTVTQCMSSSTRRGIKRTFSDATLDPPDSAPHSQESKEQTVATVMFNGYIVPKTAIVPLLPLAIKNAHPRDSYIVFDEVPHDYWVKGVRYPSVTKLIHSYFPVFQTRQVATRMAQRIHLKKYQPYWKFAYTEDHKKLPTETIINAIITHWDEKNGEASALGTRLHRYIELIYNDVVPSDTEMVEDCPERTYFERFKVDMESQGYVPYRTEYMLWDEEHKMAGMIDMLVYNTVTKKFEIWDWKRSKRIERNNRFRKGYTLCRDLDDCNYNHYTLQLNCYKWLLERNYDISISAMKIIIFHPNNDQFVLYNLSDHGRRISEIMHDRLQRISSGEDTLLQH